MQIAYDVAIVGAGPTGLTLANILGQAGVRTVLIERNPGTVQEPRAVSIDDESLRTMQAIGLIDNVLKDVAQDYGSLYFTAGGRQFAAVMPSTREYGFPRRSAFRQPDLEATLREGLKRFACVACLFEITLEAFEVRDNAVDVSLKTAKGEPVAFGVRYLVGCDGARSAIRKQIGSNLGGSTYDERWLIIDLASTKESLRQTRVICDPALPLLTLPGPAGVRRYEFMLHDGETDEIATSPDFVRKLLAAHEPDADEPIVRRQVYAFHPRLADKWREGPVFLAGDAAHLSPPFAGQGMNSGVRDAQNLGWKLGAVINGQLGPGLLDTYQAERLPHAKALVQLSINIGHVMMPRSRTQAWLTQTAFELMKLTPRIQSYFVEMKYKPKPFYEAGFTIADDPGLHMAGRMLPQPLMDIGNSQSVLLDELLGHGFALVAYGPKAQTTLSLAAACDFDLGDLNKIAIIPSDYNADPKVAAKDVVVRDMGHGFRRFHPAIKDCLILVRPDRYVAAAAPAERDAINSLAARVRALVVDTCEHESRPYRDHGADSTVVAA
jgi:3-(3-hydroxy-phenyl)propionate hydroxylase